MNFAKIISQSVAITTFYPNISGRFQSQLKQVDILFCTQICLIALIKSDQSGKLA
jgi:hypothetical protein